MLFRLILNQVLTESEKRIRAVIDKIHDPAIVLEIGLPHDGHIASRRTILEPLTPERRAEIAKSARQVADLANIGILGTLRSDEQA